MDYQIINSAIENIQTSYAIFPILPIFFGFTAVAGTIIISKVCEGTATQQLKGTKLALLGMKGAGKKQFLKNVKAKEVLDDIDEDKAYGSYRATINGKKYSIASCKESDNSILYVKNTWPSLIENNDMILFIFDLNRYLTDQDYKDLVLYKLDFLEEHNCDSSNTAVFGSHSDQITDLSNLIARIQDTVKGSSYSKFFSKNFFYGDLTRIEDIQTMCSRMFEHNVSIGKTIGSGSQSFDWDED